MCLAATSDSDLQLVLYSEDYAHCFAKGGVAVQQCGWFRSLPLLIGALGDSEYIIQTQILEQQKWFTEWDTSSPNTAINVMDKGYRTTLVAQEQGQQMLQPAFSEGDKKFNREATLYSASIAAVRSGNERAVRHLKSSWYVTKRAHRQGRTLEFLSNVWLEYGFQVNFMYSSVL